MPDVADLVANNDEWGEGELTYSRLFSGKFFFIIFFISSSTGEVGVVTMAAGNLSL